MGPVKKPETSSDIARKRLLEVGASSYLDAASALIEYQKEIQKSCRKILEANLEAYSDALGIKLTKEQVRDTVLDQTQWKGNWTHVGAYVIGGGKSNTGMTWWQSFCVLEWYYLEAEKLWFGASVKMSMPKKLAASCLHKMKAINSEIEGEDDTVWLARELQPEKADTFEGTLDDLMEQWIQVCKQGGGLRKLVG